MMGCGATVEISGKRLGCILMDRHDIPHKALVEGVRNSSTSRPDGIIQNATGQVVVEWRDKEPMFTVCLACHAKIHWECFGGWRDADGDHLCDCGCEAAA